MSAESRQHPRAQLAGIDVRYEGEDGNELVARARDIGRGGLFVETPHLVAIGEVRQLELRIAGEESPITAIARVVWARTRQEDPQRPVGMAFAFLDVDPEAVDRIGALVAGRERTISGLGRAANPAPRAPSAPRVPAAAPVRDTAIGLPREPTIGGVGGRTSHPLREQTLIGVGDDNAPPLEPEKSIPIGLVAKKEAPSRPEAERAVAVAVPKPRAVSLVDEEPARRGGAGTLAALAVLGILAGAGFVFRDRIAALVAGDARSPAEAAPVAPSASSTAVVADAGALASPAFGSAQADASTVRDGASPVTNAAVTDASAADASADASAGDGGARPGAHHAAVGAGVKKSAPAPHAPKPKPAQAATAAPPADPENPY